MTFTDDDLKYLKKWTRKAATPALKILMDNLFARLEAAERFIEDVITHDVAGFKQHSLYKVWRKSKGE